MSNGYTGSCLCGEIRYQIGRFSGAIANCHCSMCRKFHGAAFSTIASVAKTDFRWLQGESLLQAYTATNGTTRKFCSRCGSSLIFESPLGSTDMVEISIGGLDSVVDIGPNAHIFVASKASWYQIQDDLPQFAEGRASVQLYKAD